ncbi:MAG: putative lipopolysaccharide heptosyltransferase III [Magnetococcales bacterium]|nr:putative lipopolysaccharide heptosyltransferase III [Magnetococcales bacterium]MBF0157177.1 putative lipopolysaccharide heptosyltransferase III [Magnetococcales bacterium]
MPLPLAFLAPEVMRSPSRILVIKSRHLGDVLLTGPLVSTLRRNHPGARIIALVKAGTTAMLAGHPHLDEVRAFPVRTAGESRMAFGWRWFLWLRQLRGLGCDWAINTTEGDRGIVAAFLSGAWRRTGIIKGRGRRWRRWLLTEVVPRIEGERHTVVGHFELLTDPLPFGRDRSVRMAFADEDAARVEELLRGEGWDGRQALVQVHPTSRWFFKCWSDAGMARVIDHLLSLGMGVVLTSGPEARERERLTAIEAACRGRPMDLGGRLSLPQLAALSRRCRFFFGVDTAPMHLAAALGVPVVGIFGPSSVTTWGPWPNGWAGEGRSPYPEPRGVQEAFPHVAIQKDWPCVPCQRDGCEGSKRSACLEELTPEEVLPILEKVLAR